MRSIPKVTRRGSSPHHSLERGGNWSSDRGRDLPEVTQQDSGEQGLEPWPLALGVPNSSHVGHWEDMPHELGTREI